MTEKVKRDGNSKRSQPFKKIAEIKKADKKLKMAIKDDPSCFG